MKRFSAEDTREIRDELVAKAWTSGKRGSNHREHICHRAACLIGEMEDEIAELKRALLLSDSANVKVSEAAIARWHRDSDPKDGDAKQGSTRE